MVEVEAVVVRDKVEEVMDVTERTGHVGITVVEAVGHGAQPGITHEYRGRVSLNGGAHGSPVDPLLHVSAASSVPGLPPGKARLRPPALAPAWNAWVAA